MDIGRWPDMDGASAPDIRSGGRCHRRPDPWWLVRRGPGRDGPDHRVSFDGRADLDVERRSAANGDCPSTLAGNGTGAVGIDSASPDRVQFSADGIGWQSVALPGTTNAQVEGVAALGSGFVAVGAGGTTTRSPVAWWSNDGLQWTSATVEVHPGDGFVAVYAAHDGLMALSSTGDVPGLTSFWTSPDGRSWKPSAADPLGVVTEGEGQGSANGIFSGDGTRLLGYGTVGTDPTIEWWTSLDATDWTRLAITGQTTATSIADLQPFLEEDGILFNSGQTSWIGVAVP